MSVPQWHQILPRASPDLRHPLADEFEQYSWSADFGLAAPSVAATPLYTLSDRREITASGTQGWEYRGWYHDGRESVWLSKI